MASVVVLHPGEMGAALGRTLVEIGHDVYWRPGGRGPDTRRRARAAGLIERDTVIGADLVVSICPPHAALDTARSVAGFTGWYLDANAISPATAAQVAAIVAAHGAGYVDGGVIGPPPTAPGTTRLYLSGPAASGLADLLAGARLQARVLDGPDFAASSLKMAYAAWTKISAALLVAAQGAADELGVGPALAQEWALSQPALLDRHRTALASAQQKGWRWEEEMRQIASTFTAAGQPAGFAEGAAALFARYPRPEGQ